MKIPRSSVHRTAPAAAPAINRMGMPASGTDMKGTVRTFAECIPFMCGHPSYASADAATQDIILSCSQAGFTSSLSCVDEACIQAGYGCRPGPLTVVPPVTKTAITPMKPKPQPGVPKAPSLPVLTPQSIVAPVPSITDSLRPEDIAECSQWEDLNASIAQNPLIAIGIAVGIFVLIRSQMKGG